MTLRKIKLFIGVSVLLAYVSICVFGLLKFSHTSEMPMPICPYTQNGSALCQNSLDHINNWQQFSNTTFSLLFIFSIIIFGITLRFINQRNFLNLKQYFYKWKYYLYNKKLSKYPNKVIKWLSLFENSPSFSYVRHN